MKKIKFIIFHVLIFFGTGVVSELLAYTHEVRPGGSGYIWRVNNQDQGSTSSLAVAIENAMGTDRDIHILTSGTLTSTINISHSGVRLHGHNNTLTCNFSGSGILNNGNDGFEIHDLTLKDVAGGYGIRSSQASNLSFTDLTLINIDWIGMRIDSRTSNPWSYTEYNLYMRDITVNGSGSHGIETYGIDGVDFDGTMTVSNAGGCGVLLNDSHNGTLETVDAYNCDWGGGYAGLRYANGCTNITTNKLIADRCGRGFFIVQSGPSINCHLNNAEIYECSDVGIWIENGTNCSVKAGCSMSGVAVSGSGSFANVSSICGGSGSYYNLTNRHTSKCVEVDGGSTSNNADITQNSCNSSHWRQQWELVDVGSGYLLIRNRNSGKCLRNVNGDLVQYDCNSSYWSEQFSRQDVGGGYFLLKNRHSNTCLRLSSGSNGASVVLETCYSSYWSEQFSLSSASSRLESDDSYSVFQLDEELKNTELLVYPNPATNQFVIELSTEPQSGKYSLLSLSGKLVKSQEFSEQVTPVEVSQIPAGIYVLEVETNEGKVSRRLVIN